MLNFDYNLYNPYNLYNLYMKARANARNIAGQKRKKKQ